MKPSDRFALWGGALGWVALMVLVSCGPVLCQPPKLTAEDVPPHEVEAFEVRPVVENRWDHGNLFAITINAESGLLTGIRPRRTAGGATVEGWFKQGPFTVEMRDLRTGELVKEVALPVQEGVTRLAVSPARERLAAVTREGSLWFMRLDQDSSAPARLYRFNREALMAARGRVPGGAAFLDFPREIVFGCRLLRFSPSGRLLAAHLPIMDQRMRYAIGIFDAAKGKALCELAQSGQQARQARSFPAWFASGERYFVGAFEHKPMPAMTMPGGRRRVVPSVYRQREPPGLMRWDVRRGRIVSWKALDTRLSKARQVWGPYFKAIEAAGGRSDFLTHARAALRRAESSGLGGVAAAPNLARTMVVGVVNGPAFVAGRDTSVWTSVLCLWDARTGRKKVQIAPNEGPGMAAGTDENTAVAPDGRLVAWQMGATGPAQGRLGNPTPSGMVVIAPTGPPGSGAEQIHPLNSRILVYDTHRPWEQSAKEKRWRVASIPDLGGFKSMVFLSDRTLAVIDASEVTIWALEGVASPQQQ